MRPRRISLRSFLIAITIVAAVMGSWVSAQMSWVRQRRALLNEGLATLAASSNYASGVTTDEVPPSGSTLSQRILQVFGEAPADDVFVFYFVSDRDVTIQDGYETPFKTTDYPKVHRARNLFPEATIYAVVVEREHVRAGHFSEFAGLISE